MIYEIISIPNSVLVLDAWNCSKFLQKKIILKAFSSGTKWLIPFLNHSFLISYVFQLFNFIPRTFSRASLLTFNFLYRNECKKFNYFYRSLTRFFMKWTNTNKRSRSSTHFNTKFIEINKTFFSTHVVISRCFSIICSYAAWNGSSSCAVRSGEEKKRKRS